MISLEQVKAEAAKIADSRINPGPRYGDNVGCRYSVLEDGTIKHCIAGTIVKNLGGKVPPPKSRYNNKSINAIQKYIGLKLDQQAVSYLEQLQSMADAGASWLEAVVNAE